MNPLQMALQIRHKLRAITWPAGSKVFNDRAAFVFSGTPDEKQIPPTFPWCLISLDGGTPDEDHPELIEQAYTLLTAALVAGDPLGEFAVVGGAREDFTKSAGAGIGEVAERVRSAVEDLLGVDGAKIILSSTRTGTPAPFGQGRHGSTDELGLTAMCTSALAYAAPQELTESGGTFTWSGAHCSDRFDFVQYRLGYASDGTAVETPAEATIVYTGTDPTTAPGAFSGLAYSVWADYNMRGASAVQGTSSGTEVGAFVTP